MDSPPSWSHDPLTAFFDLAREHAFGSFHNLKGEYSQLRAIDEAFQRLIERWLDPENPFVAPFVLRAFSAFRAAAQLGISGQLPESYTVLRGCLEFALYGSYIAAHPDAWSIWQNRETDEASRKKCVSTFSGRNLFSALRARDARLGDIAGQLYERTIDFGAHPNEMAVGSNMQMHPAPDGGLQFFYNFLSGDGTPLRLCLKSLAQVGVIVLDIFGLVFPTRFSELGIALSVDPLKARL